jgi:hypothetical protein
VIADAELAAELWLHFLAGERAVIAGRTHALDSEAMAILTGERPAFASAAEWRELVAKRPEPKPYKRRKRHQITFPGIDQRYV